MSDPYDLDLVVIGAGTGVSVARACASEAWAVAMVDAFPYGGTCALRGCDPKKMLAGVTEAADWVRRMAGRGLRVDRSEIDWSEMMAFKRTFTDAMPDRIENGLQGLDVETLHGSAAFTGPNEVRIGDRVIRSRHVNGRSRPISWFTERVASPASIPWISRRRGSGSGPAASP